MSGPPKDPVELGASSAVGLPEPLKVKKGSRGDPGGLTGSADQIVAIGLMAVALYVLYDTRLYPPSIVEGAPGPALFPRVLAGALLVLSLVLLLTGRRKRASVAQLRERGGMRRIGVVILLMVGFLALVEAADFYVLIFLLLGTVNYVAGEKRVHVLLLVPAAFVLFVYLVFYRTFGVVFPTHLF